MPISQAQIDELLEQLKHLLAQITPIRQQMATLEKQLAQVQREYDKHLGEHNSEANRLEMLKHSLKARLARKPTPIMQEPTTQAVPEAIQPPEVVEIALSPDEPPPPPPAEEPGMVPKRALANHIYYFLDPSQSAIMQTINALLIDGARGIGEMLELLEWGEIWSARADWEPLEEQYQRLEGWQAALTERWAFWQAEEQRLKGDSRYALWRERDSRSSEEWLALLQGLTEQQKIENERLAQEVAILEQAWQQKQAESEGNHA